MGTKKCLRTSRFGDRVNILKTDSEPGLPEASSSGRDFHLVYENSSSTSDEMRNLKKSEKSNAVSKSVIFTES